MATVSVEQSRPWRSKSKRNAINALWIIIKVWLVYQRLYTDTLCARGFIEALIYYSIISINNQSTSFTSHFGRASEQPQTPSRVSPKNLFTNNNSKTNFVFNPMNIEFFRLVDVNAIRYGRKLISYPICLVSLLFYREKKSLIDADNDNNLNMYNSNITKHENTYVLPTAAASTHQFQSI